MPGAGPKPGVHKPPPEAYATPTNERTLRRLERMLGEQLWKCAYCQRHLSVEDATQDHVVPRSRGGRGVFNLVAACRRCNSDKADLAPWEWTDRWYEKEEEQSA
jgi:5-methylcytosine-specific restriction endonuclease McrA